MQLAPHPFTLRQLQYVVAVADRKSFRKAAEACHVAQPSLSAQIAQVEDLLGVKLFERDRRNVVLTAAGRALVERARGLLLGADELAEAARAAADPLSATLRIGVIPTIAPYLLPEVAPALREKLPRMTFVWREEKTPTLVDLLAKAELDAAIVALEAELGNPPHRVLGKDTFVLAAAPSHRLGASDRPIKAEELDGERVLLLDDGHCFRDQALSFCAGAGAEEAGYRATSLPTLVQMTAGGAGVTLLPTLAVGVENRRQALRVRSFGKKPPYRTIALIWRRGSALLPSLERVGETLAASYAKLCAR